MGIGRHRKFDMLVVFFAREFFIEGYILKTSAKPTQNRISTYIEPFVYFANTVYLKWQNTRNTPI